MKMTHTVSTRAHRRIRQALAYSTYGILLVFTSSVHCYYSASFLPIICLSGWLSRGYLSVPSMSQAAPSSGQPGQSTTGAADALAGHSGLGFDTDTHHRKSTGSGAGRPQSWPSLYAKGRGMPTHCTRVRSVRRCTIGSHRTARTPPYRRSPCEGR